MANLHHTANTIPLDTPSDLNSAIHQLEVFTAKGNSLPEGFSAKQEYLKAAETLQERITTKLMGSDNNSKIV